MAKKRSAEVQKMLDVFESDEPQVLVILIVPSHDKNKKELPNQDVWADTALRFLGDLYGGATAFSAYAGIYKDKSTGNLLWDKPILIESYAAMKDVKDEQKLQALVDFMKRMGRELRQLAVGVVIHNAFIEITDF
jgi:hypothetical protein